MPHRFDPFDVGDNDPEPRFVQGGMIIPPGGGAFPDPADFIRFAKAIGIIPEDVDDGHVMIGVIGPDGPVILGEEGPVSLGDPGGGRSNSVGKWKPGTPLPHTTFDDPPFMQTREEWQEKLSANAIMAEDRELFVVQVQHSLGYDMIRSHGVPDDVAMAGCEEFAYALYDQFHDDAAQHD